MPLLVKGRKLIPANDNLQVCCWAENGFFFPIMRKKNKMSSVKPLSVIMKENANLPKDPNDMSFIPKRYLDYFKDTSKNR